MRNIVLPVVGVTVVVVIVAFVLRWRMSVVNQGEGSGEYTAEHALYVETTEAGEGTKDGENAGASDSSQEEIITEEMKKLYANADYVSVELVERTTVEDESGNSETEYDRYLMSDVNLKDGADWTEDYHDSLADGLFDETANRDASFDEVFGFSYAGLNGWELYEKLLEVNGFDGSLTKVTFDEDTNQLTGQRLYVMNEDCSVIDNLLSGEVYDQVQSSKVTYSMAEDSKGNLVPECFNAEVIYTYKNQKITKNLYVQVLINYWGEEDANEEI